MASGSAIANLRPSAIFHLAGAPQVAESWHDRTKPLAGNVLATAHLLDAVRRAELGCRVLVSGSAAVYAPSDRPIKEDDAGGSRKSVRPEQAGPGTTGDAGVRRRRPGRCDGSRFQPHRPTSASGFRGAEHGSADCAHRARPGRARHARRQPRRAARLHGRPRRRARVRRHHGARRGWRDLQRRLGNRSEHPIPAGRPSVTMSRGGSHRDRPGTASPGGNLGSGRRHDPSFVARRAGSQRSHSTQCSTICWTSGGRKFIERE